ncbi:MFS transporter [Hyphomicrobiales bacterium]|jgi:MFS family permease|nr:MFS transporter [Hyphomicrobiales bacterium]
MSDQSLWPSKRYAWFLTTILLISYTVSFIDRAMINLLIDPIRSDLKLTDIQMGQILGPGFMISYILFSLPIGRMVDKFNRIFVLIGGILLWSIATAAHGFSSDYYSLFVSRAGVGAGEAAVTPASWSIIADLFRPEDRAFPMSFYLMGPYIGQGLALLFGGLVIQLYTVPVEFLGFTLQPWQMIFILIAIPGFILSFGLAFLADPQRKGIINKEKQKDESFVDVVAYIKSKFSAYFTLMIAASFIVVLLYTFQAWVPTYIARVHGWDLSRVGYLFGIVTLISGSLGVLSGPVLERFLDRRGFKNSTHAVFLISASTLAVIPPLTFLFVTEDFILPGMFVISFFITLPMACFASGLQKMTPQNYRGSISGLYVFIMNIVGLSLGPTVVPFFTSVIFQDDMSINLALSYTFLIFGPISFAIFFLGRKSLNKALLDNQ